jgi:hypothetical protein
MGIDDFKKNFQGMVNISGENGKSGLGVEGGKTEMK